MAGFPYPRYDRYPGGAVPQGNRTPEQQLAHLDANGFVAVKERAKLLLRIEEAKKPKPAEAKAGPPVSKYQAKQDRKRE